MEGEILQPTPEPVKEYFIYKLQYADIASAYLDLIGKGVIDENRNYINNTQAVVELPREDRFDMDIMTLNTQYVFENEIHPKTPDHNFMGFGQTPIEENI